MLPAGPSFWEKIRGKNQGRIAALLEAICFAEAVRAEAAGAAA
jgi:hypothetical protein